MTAASLPVLALDDGTSSSANAAWRAALVARDLGLSLRLLCAARAGPGPALALDIGQRLGIDVEPVLLRGDPLKDVVAAARQAQLVVLGAGRGNPLRNFVLGTQAERLIRLCRVPVLVVKRPATGSYRRVLVPVTLEAGGSQALAMAARVSRGAGLELLHAVEDRSLSVRVADAPEALVRQLRDAALVRARAALEGVVAQAAAAQSVRPLLAFGDPAMTILAREQAARCDLVVIGKRKRGLLADFFLGSVTQRVLAGSRADVLVWPRADPSAVFPTLSGVGLNPR